MKAAPINYRETGKVAENLLLNADGTLTRKDGGSVQELLAELFVKTECTLPLPVSVIGTANLQILVTESNLLRRRTAEPAVASHAGNFGPLKSLGVPVQSDKP